MKRTHTLIVRLSTLAFVLLAAGGIGFAECIDDDMDGYGDPASGDCTFALLDCDDDDGDVNPGADEICGDGIDNDCDPSTDFDPMVGMMCVKATPPCLCTDPHACPELHVTGCCFTGGLYECSGDLLSLECAPLGEITMMEPEQGGPDDPSCSDHKDNNCNGTFDFGEDSCNVDVELCDGLDDDGSGRESGASTAYDCADSEDNDGDGKIDLNDPDCLAAVDDPFTTLGDACFSDGMGECIREGVIVCAEDGTTECSADPGNPVAEGPPQGFKCTDGKDNDCDGVVDLADMNCQTDEICDGLDNDGNDGADEDFANKGMPCSDGDGACEAAGSYVCAANGSGTVCDAQAALPATEGPIGPTCSDGIDNDCDGLADDMDPGCIGEINVTCALPHGLGEPGGDCTGYFRVEYEVEGASQDAEVTAELLAMNVDGSILDIRPVQLGEVAHLRSRIDPADWLWVTRRNKRKGGELIGTMDFWHEVFAPIPVLRVTVEDMGLKSQAFCSPIPYLQVIEPNGDVQTSSGGSTKVLAAIPLVDEGELSILVDGVDILDELGIDPATAFPGTAMGGTVLIGGHSVMISDITVDTTDDYQLHSSNTVMFTMSDLGCGGHVVKITGDQVPGALPDPHSAECHEDDFLGCGLSSVFAVRITDPMPQQVTNAIPTPVMGEVCHGLPVSAIQVNGKDLDVPDPTAMMTEVDDCPAADTFTYLIDTTIPQTDLRDDVDGLTTELGTFDPGSNRVFAVATDTKANRSSDSHIFAVGEVIPPTFLSDPTATRTQLWRSQIDGAVQNAITVGQAAALTATEQTDAFVIGLDPNALTTFFSETCLDASETMKAEIKKSLEGLKFTEPVEIDGACDPDVTTTINQITFTGEPVCFTELADNPAGNRERTAADGPPPPLREDPNATDSDCADKMDNDSDGLIDGKDPDCHFVGGSDCSDGIDNDMDGQTDGADAGCQEDSGNLRLVVEAPTITAATTSYGHCHGFAWAVTVTIDVDMSTTFPDLLEPLKFNFDFNEDNLENGGTVLGEFVPPEDARFVITRDDSGGGGWAVFLLEVINFFGDLLIFIFTFGQADVDFDLVPSFTGLTENIDLKSKIMVEQFPLALMEIKPDEMEVADTDKLLDAELDYAKIRQAGLTLSLKGVFQATSNDPAIEDTPGFSPTPAMAPMPPQGDRNTFFVISDDALNQLFASMSEQGEIKTECFGSDTGATIDDLLPPDCFDLEVMDDPAATAIVWGLCLGLRAADLQPTDPNDASALCETLITDVAGDPTKDLQRAGQGLCHGMRPADNNCNFIPGNLLEKIICAETPDFNLKASDPVLYCMQQENPPPILIDDQNLTDDVVDAVLRMNDTLVGIVVDRDGNGFPASELQILQGCFDEGTNNTIDCKGLALCMDLNLETTLGLQTEMGTGELQIVPLIGSLLIGDRPEGAPCEGGVNFGTDEGSLDGAMDSDSLKIDLFNNINMGSPPIEPDGIDFNGIVTFDNPKLIAIESGFNADFQDYVGVSGNIVSPSMVAPPRPQEEESLSGRPASTPAPAETEAAAKKGKPAEKGKSE